jgi:hypothetical protein
MTPLPLLLAAAPKVAAPTAVLALRGGAIVDPALWIKIFSGYMGAYGLGFVLAPALLLTQNFVMEPDKFHTFMARITGVMICTLIYLFNTIPQADAVKVGTIFSVAVFLAGPLYAQLNFKTTPMHNAAFLMVPLIAAGCLAM